MISQENQVLEYYNKHQGNERHGTLMGNWWEEQTLREQTKVGRTTYNRHITKKREDLYLAPYADIEYLKDQPQMDSTKDRTMGKEKYAEYSLTSRDTGKGSLNHQFTQNKGPRESAIDKKYMEIINSEIREMEEKQKQDAKQTYFNTLYQQDFQTKDLMTNTIGKRVMKTQDLKDITK